ncbi:hypothetical protein B4915_08445 [Leucobacter massiliensis]|uniref:Ig-like domain-containing protein n=1 Tax=Leucobacter massiliensis TaxID=1686285 RepID=A0A2S9QMV1_9MICO|nr:hypothetical protein B4915_08445 [Leucobacter massiliensis]
MALPLTVFTDAGDAQAADGQGAGRALSIGVGSDGFAAPPGKSWNLVPSPVYPGTVRIEGPRGTSCLATEGGKNDGHEHGVQWTKCNNDASKNWVIEPLSTAPASTDLTAQRDDTDPEANLRDDHDSPIFILRSWKYPQHCLFSQGAGFDGAEPKNPNGRTRGITPDCAGDAAERNPSLQFSVLNDTEDRTEWGFLRERMALGAAAFHGRAPFKAFTGKNLWTRPLDLAMNYVGKHNEATSDGYFLPDAIALDPAKEATVFSESTVSLDCVAGGWWQGIDNSNGSGTVTQSVTTEQQHTDQWAVGLGIEGSIEQESKESGTKVGVKINGHVEYANTNSRTDSRTITMEVPAGKWGMAVVSVPAVTAFGNWKSGTALGRVWKFNGPLTVAKKNSAGQPVSTTVANVNSRERKSCIAQGATVLEPGAPFRVTTRPGSLSPQPGDTVSAEVHFIEPAGDPPLDVRYQWFADDREIAGATDRDYRITEDAVGRKLSFAAYENGGAMRYESQTYLSQQTAPVAAASLAGKSADESPELPEGFAGRPYSVVLAGTSEFGDAVTLANGEVPGLAFDPATGTLAGIPTEVGTFTLSFTGEGAAPTEAKIQIDPAPTVFPSAAGYSVRVGDPVSIPLVAEPGTDAAYSVEFLDEHGGARDKPGGLRIEHDQDGSPRLLGTPTAAGVTVIRVSEQSPHPSAEDARESSSELRLEVSGDPHFAYHDGEVLRIPLQQHAELSIAQMAPGGDPLAIAGELPPGLSFDGAAASLSGVPEAEGSWEITVGPSAEGESRTLRIEVYDAPSITLERLDDAATTPDIRVGAPVAWLVRATPSDDMQVTVTSVGSDAEVDWAELSSALREEIAIDGTPTAAGAYRITVRAQNAAGESTREFPIEVLPDQAPVPEETEPDEADDAPRPSDEPPADTPQATGGLARTGAPEAAPALIPAALLALAAGAWALARARRATPSARAADRHDTP